MKLYCEICHKPCTSEISDSYHFIVRGLMVCPECLEAERCIIPEWKTETSTDSGG